MQVVAAIFDMDGLLIDSEPLWREAGQETLARYHKILTDDQYLTTTGLRTEEWVAYWFRYFDLPMTQAAEAVEIIIEKAIAKIGERGIALPGVDNAIQTCREHQLKIGLATSSPMALANVVLQKLRLQNAFDAITSAEHLPYGKPHPLVYLNCAEQLGCAPIACVAFEDSFNGMIAAKAARMKCIVVPEHSALENPKWHAADLKLNSLAAFEFGMLTAL